MVLEGMGHRCAPHHHPTQALPLPLQLPLLLQLPLFLFDLKLDIGELLLQLHLSLVDHLGESRRVVGLIRVALVLSLCAGLVACNKKSEATSKTDKTAAAKPKKPKLKDPTITPVPTPKPVATKAS